MADATSTEALLEGLLSQLPAGANPYEAINAYLWTTMDHNLPASFFTQLHVVSGCLAFNMFAALTALVLLVCFRSFWIYRVEAGALRVHATTPWLLGGSLFYFLAIITIYRSIPYYRGEEVVRELVGLRIFEWYAPWTGGWVAAHFLYSSWVAHMQTVSTLSLRSAQKWQRVVTYTMLTIQLAFYGCMTPLGVVAVRKYNRMLDAFETLDAMTKAAAAAYTGTFDMASLATAAPYLEALQQGQADLLDIMRIVYLTYGAWTCVLGLGVISGALFWSLSLGRTLRRAAALRNTGTSNPLSERQTAQFRRTYRWLSLTFWLFGLIDIGFTAVAFYTGTHIKAAMSDPKASQAVDLTMYWLYFVVGCPVGVLVVVHILRTHHSAKQDGTSGTSGAQIRTFGSSGPHSRFSKRGGGVGVGGVAVDVSTVIAVHELDTMAGGEEGRREFELVDIEQAKAKELYYLSLEEGVPKEPEKKITFH
ncbi:hypothetical protein JCM10207_003050 [Rhodosporidiobolus poonsookiae]